MRRLGREPCACEAEGKSAEVIYNAKSRFNMKVTAVYKDNMKLLNYFGKKKDELYNLARDPGESENLIVSKREVASELLHSTASISTHHHAPLILFT